LRRREVSDELADFIAEIRGEKPPPKKYPQNPPP
jgi:hypothetical protein